MIHESIQHLNKEKNQSFADSSLTEGRWSKACAEGKGRSDHVNNTWTGVSWVVH